MADVQLRKFPYPYRAALAISNDTDHMDDQFFRLLHKYLNTGQETSLGRGLNLPVGDSFFLFSSPESPNKFTFLEGLSNGLSSRARMLKACAESGVIDTLHTYGCFASPQHFSRDLAQRGIEQLDRNGMSIKVWVNHGSKTNVQCFGLTRVPHYLGDMVGSPFYHTDLMLSYGLRYCWLGDEITDSLCVDAYNTPRSIMHRGEIAMRHLSKRYHEAGVSKVKPLLRSVSLRDGNDILSFLRYTATGGATPVLDDLPVQLSASNLNLLKRIGGFAVIYQHFAVRRRCNGYGVDSYRANEPPYFRREEQDALERLSSEYHGGNIFVTTTSKLLQYNLLQRGLRWEQETLGDSVRVSLLGVQEPNGRTRPIGQDEISGLTFYTTRPRDIEIYIRNGINEDRVKNLRCNPPDATGRESVTVPLAPVEWPD